MPSYRHHEPGDLFVHFTIKFPDRIDPALVPSLERVLPPRAPLEKFPKNVALEEVEASADMKKRRSKKPWWLALLHLVDILGGREDLSEAPVHPRAGIHSLVKDTVRDYRPEGPIPGLDD